MRGSCRVSIFPSTNFLSQKHVARQIRRRVEDAAYTVARHVEVLTAMMGEARILRESSY